MFKINSNIVGFLVMSLMLQAPVAFADTHCVKITGLSDTSESPVSVVATVFSVSRFENDTTLILNNIAPISTSTEEGVLDIHARGVGEYIATQQSPTNDTSLVVINGEFINRDVETGDILVVYHDGVLACDSYNSFALYTELGLIKSDEPVSKNETVHTPQSASWNQSRQLRPNNASDKFRGLVSSLFSLFK